MASHRYLVGLALAGAMLLAAVAAPPGADDLKDKGAAPEKPTPRELVRVQTIEAPGEIATEFGPPLRCDQDGNLYLQAETFGSGVRKLSPKGKRLATYNPNADPAVKTNISATFALDADGTLYALADAQDTITRYVFVYRADGGYKSTIKLDPGFAWEPSALGVFPSGELLITGLRYARDADRRIVQIPFTGLFRSNGTLLKEIAPEEDSALQELAEAGDKMLKVPRVPASNLAISFSQTAVAQDGNLYLMRWYSPAILYAISPGGEVVRRFAVDPGDQKFHPMAMHVSGNRMAVHFFNSQTGENLMKIVDLEGNEIATYTQGKTADDQRVGAAFVCYRAEPQQFTFLGATSESKLQLIIAEGR